MSRAISKNYPRSAKEKTLWLAVVAAIFVLSLSVSYSLRILPLGAVLLIGAVPLLTLLLIIHQETLLLLVVTAYFGAGYLYPDVVVQGLVRSIVLLFIGLALLFQLLLKKSLTRTSTPLDKFLAFWLMVIAASFVYGFYVEGNSMRYLLGDTYKLTEIILIFWLTTVLVKKTSQVRFLIWGFLAVALAFGMLDSLIFFKQAPLFGDILLARVRIAAQFSSIFAFLLVLSLVLHEKSTMTKAILGVLGFFFFMSFALTFLRTGYIAIPLTLAVLLPLYLYKRRRYVLPTLAKLAALVVFLLIFIGVFNLILTSIDPNMDIIRASVLRFSSLITPASEDPMGVRMLEISSIISQALAQNPLLGKGLGGEYYGATLVEAEVEWGVKHYVHNNYFDFLIRTGILGLVVFIILAFKYLKAAIRFYLRSRDSFYQGSLLGCIAVFVCSCVIALSTSILYSPFLFMMMGLTFCLGRLEEREVRMLQRT